MGFPIWLFYPPKPPSSCLLLINVRVADGKRKSISGWNERNYSPPTAILLKSGKARRRILQSPHVIESEIN
ncbi:unnamed protein product [Allacma fusca]|uniref:Uncharacterized protein n=1 Tax=Allacma fusca TaxID=39272 RepID=A0A8J2P1L3_9HEXA|nr:unnamed protein product [Allacma fusca]